MIAGLDRAHFAPHLLDHAGGFMAQYQRARIGVGAFDHVQVRVANTNGLGADQHFARARLADTDFFDNQRGTHLVEYGSFHD
ncbi:hypothetical protein D3C84_784830 [compost metagenome]